MDCRKKNRKHGNRNTNIKLKEHGYLPHADEDHRILSGRLSYKAARLYVTLVVEEKAPKKPNLTSGVIGLDRGIKEFVVTSTGMFCENINKSRKLRKLYKKIKPLQRAMATRTG